MQVIGMNMILVIVVFLFLLALAITVVHFLTRHTLKSALGSLLTILAGLVTAFVAPHA